MASSMMYCILLVCVAVAFALPAGDDETHEKPTPTLPGACPDFTPVASLDSSKINGDWFGVYGLKNGFEMKHTVKCIKKTITAKPDGGFEAVLTKTKEDGQTKSKTFVATPVDGKNTKLTLKKDTEDASDDKPSTKTLTVLATDANYLVSVICGSDGTNHGYMVEVLARSKTLADADLEKIKAALKSVNINAELKAIDQSC